MFTCRLRPAAALAFCLLASLTAQAAANVPASVTNTNTVRIPTAGNMADGTLTTKVTYTNTAASAAASTGNTVGLSRGYQFRLRTCVAYHLNGRSPVSSCAVRDVAGVMLVIHGGGWTATSIGGVQAMRGEADRWRARGWETVNLTYRPCGQSAADVLWFHDKARAWFGAGAKMCTTGISAGGHLALQVGAQRPNLYCAVSEAGPTDLRTVQNEPAYDAATGQHSQTTGGRWIHNLAAAAFGEENLAANSPAAQASATLKSTRVLQGFSADDALVPYQQAADLADAMRAADPAAYVDSVQLPIGTVAFGHGQVTQSALDDFYAREVQLVAPITAPTVPLNKR